MTGERGVYTAERAAALSGIPRSTVYRWARAGSRVPSVSPTRVKRWSFKNLLILRAIHWLRHPAPNPDGERFPTVPEPVVRATLAELAQADLEGLRDERLSVRVDRAGAVHVGLADDGGETGSRRPLDSLDLIEPFECRGGSRGPDLVAPRPLLRIVPGKLGGAPHLLGTRLQTEALAAIYRQGMSRSSVYRLYPRFDPLAIDQALDLEDQLAQNHGRPSPQCPARSDLDKV
jgi:uncharacterized protein (DUF433 family)